MNDYEKEIQAWVQCPCGWSHPKYNEAELRASRFAHSQLPKQGWVYTGYYIEDASMNFNCGIENCGASIRYKHYMYHKETKTLIGIGCQCAMHMIVISRARHFITPVDAKNDKTRNMKQNPRQSVLALYREEKRRIVEKKKIEAERKAELEKKRAEEQLALAVRNAKLEEERRLQKARAEEELRLRKVRDEELRKLSLCTSQSQPPPYDNFRSQHSLKNNKSQHEIQQERKRKQQDKEEAEFKRKCSQFDPWILSNLEKQAEFKCKSFQFSLWKSKKRRKK